MESSNDFQLKLTKYNAAAKICGDVYSTLKSLVLDDDNLSIKELCIYGNNMINDKCLQIFKREKNKGVGFPVSISLNNCVGNYVYEDSQSRFNTIQVGDVVKVEVGVNIGGCIAVLGETFVKSKKEQDAAAIDKENEYISFLNTLTHQVVNKLMRSGETNDEIRFFVESECTKEGCFPVENCIGYQHLDDQLKTNESKYIVLNHQKYYDDDDNLCVEENVCFDLEQGEVYTLNLTIVQDIPNDSQQTEHVYKELHPPHIYRFNEYFYNLKLKSAREFAARVKKESGRNAFVLNDKVKTNKDKMGLKECVDSGILDNYQVLYHKHGFNVYHKKITIVIGEKKGIMLKYN